MIENHFSEDELVVIYNWLLEKETAGYTLAEVIDEQFDRKPNCLS